MNPWAVNTLGDQGRKDQRVGFEQKDTEVGKVESGKERTGQIE